MRSLLLALLLLSFSAFGQNAYYSSGDCWTSGSSSPQSCSVDASTLPNRGLVVSIRSGGNTPGYTTGCQYAGVPMTPTTPVDEEYFAGANNNSGTVHLYYLNNPATGTNTLQCTSSAGVGWQATYMVITGVKQTGQPEAFAHSGVDCHNSTLCSASVTTLTSGAWVVAGVANSTGNISCTGHGENCSNRTGVSASGSAMATVGPISVPASTALTYSLGNGIDNAASTVVISLAPAAVAPSFTISPTIIPNGHTNNITLTLTGSGTSWTGSTVFTTSVVANVTKISQNVTSGTTATLVVTTGAGTGSLTVTESVTGTAVATTTVNVPSVSIAPTSGVISTTPTITFTGVNTIWSLETASGLFTVAGGSGASIGVPTISSNTSATAVLTVGSGTGPLTITDTSTGKTVVYTATGSITFSITPSVIPSGHGGNISLALVGIGTSWSGSSVFTASGCTKVSQTWGGTTTTYTVVVTTSAAGTCTLTESVTGTAASSATISVPTFSINVSTGNLKSIQTLTVTGSSTLWNSETAVGLFSVSGGAASSIGTPTINSDTSATVALTVGTANGNLTITDTSTGKTATFVAGGSSSGGVCASVGGQ